MTRPSARPRPSAPSQTNHRPSPPAQASLTSRQNMINQMRSRMLQNYDLYIQIIDKLTSASSVSPNSASIRTELSVLRAQVVAARTRFAGQNFTLHSARDFSTIMQGLSVVRKEMKKFMDKIGDIEEQIEQSTLRLSR